jgi:hypothetical protein
LPGVQGWRPERCRPTAKGLHEAAEEAEERDEVMIVRLGGYPQRKRLVWNKWWFELRGGGLYLTAALFENVRVNGELEEKLVRTLAHFDESRYALSNETDKVGARVRFWNRVRRKLDALGARLTPEEREKAEDLLAARVSKPTAEEIESYRATITAKCSAR